MAEPIAEPIIGTEVMGSVTDTIKAPIGAVWAIVGNYGCEAAYLPDQVSRITLKGSGVGAIRHIWFRPFNGLPAWDVDERLEVLDPVNYRVQYSKVDDPNDPYASPGQKGNIQLREIDEETTEVTWTCRSSKIDPAEKDFLRNEVEVRYRSLISAVRKVVE